MPSPESVTRWIDLLQAGDHDAVRPLWERYFGQLVLRARAALRGKANLGADAEDVALSAFLGVVLAKMGQLDEAIACYKRSIECDSDFFLPHNNLGVALRKKGDLRGAIACYKQAIERDPTSALAHYNLGYLLYDIGQLDEALAEYRQVVHLEPYDGDHHSVLGKCLQKMGHLDEAISEYREAIQLEPDEASYHSSLGNVLEEKGQLDEAISEFRRAIQLHRQEKDGPESIGLANVLALLGSALLKQQKWTEAEAVLRECLTIRREKQPDDWTTFDTCSLLGAALLGQKKYADAEPPLVQGYEGMKQRETTLPPQGKVRLSEALERLGRLYEATDKKDKARQGVHATGRNQSPR